MRWLFVPLIAIIILGVSMSLHDIDKNNSNRITPLLNSADDVQQRMAQGTNGVQNTNDVDEVDGLQFRERQIIAVQDGENKAAFGFYGTANKFGLKVAEDGVDVLTAADSQLIFNSEQNVFKIVKSGTATLTPSNTGSPLYTVANGGYTLTVNFDDIGGTPGVVAFFQYPYSLTSGSYTIFTTNKQSMPYLGVLSTGTPIGQFFYEVTSSTIKFYYNQFTSIDFGVTPNIVFSYFILQETID